MKVRYTRQAILDLLIIADYVGERNPFAAADVEAAIRCYHRPAGQLSQNRA